jgi:hypothetical protein
MYTKRPTRVFFLVPTNLSNHMDKQARTHDIVLFMSREMTCIGANHCRGGWSGEGQRRHETKYIGPLAYSGNMGSSHGCSDTLYVVTDADAAGTYRYTLRVSF